MERLRITELGTILSDDGFEMTLEKFLKKLEKKVKSKYYSVIYNEKDTNFYIRYNGYEYVLELDSKLKEDVIKRKYDDSISRLMKVSNAQPEMNKNCVEIELDEKRRKKIIDDAENGILPNDEARFIYLDYLENRKADLLMEYFFGDLGVYGNKSMEDCIKVFFQVSGFFAAIGLGLGCIFGKAFDSLYPVIGCGLFGFALPTLLTSHDVSFFEMIRERRMIKHKIKQLEVILDKSSLNFKKSKLNTNSESVLVPIKVYHYEFKDTIYKEVSNLLDKIESVINLSDKIELKKEVKCILERYNIGLKEAQKGELGSSDVVALQYRIRNELVILDTKVDGVLAKEITEVEMKNENAILQKRLEEPIVIDSEEIDGTLRKREENKAPVRVKRKDLSRVKTTY